MADLPYIQEAQEVKITGQDSTGDTVNYVSADANGNMHVILPADIVITGIISALNGTVVADGAQQPYNTFFLELAGTWSTGTQIEFEGSTDNTNWFSVFAVQANTATSTPNNGSNGGFGRLTFRGLCSGVRYIRCRANTYITADSVSIKIVLTSGEGPSMLDSAVPVGDNVIGRFKITDGTDVALVSVNGDLKIVDGLRNGGVYGLITVTTGSTPVEAKIGASRLTNRKFLQITANATGMFYGLDSSVTTTTGSPIASGQTISFSIDPDSTFAIFVCATTNGKTFNTIECP